MTVLKKKVIRYAKLIPNQTRRIILDSNKTQYFEQNLSKGKSSFFTNGTTINWIVVLQSYYAFPNLM